MDEFIKSNSYDDVSEMIENNTEATNHPSPEKMKQAWMDLISSEEEERSNDLWLNRYQTLDAYTLDVVRDGSDDYFKALTEAILALISEEYGHIDYKGYKITLSDTPRIKSISLKDGNKEYSYEICFHCDALSLICYEEYHSEEEKKAFLDPENDLFEKTLALLDKQIEELDKGTWVKERRKLDIYDFKDYSPDNRQFKRIEWDDREKDAEETLSFLIEDAHMRTKGLAFCEDDFEIFADVIRRMVFFADYGKRNYLAALQGFIWYEWKPTTKRNRYIWICMDEYGQGDLPDRLLDNCTMYYLVDDPQGWEAMAYLLPIVALLEMCQDYDPDSVKDVMLRIFDLFPGKGYRERVEKLIKEDRAKAEKGESVYDKENI